MKLKMTMIYGEDLCEMLKEYFGCSTDQELLIIMYICPVVFSHRPSATTTVRST